MKVRDLIKELQALDPDLEVVVTDYVHGTGPVISVEKVQEEDHWSPGVTLPWKLIDVARLDF